MLELVEAALVASPVAVAEETAKEASEDADWTALLVMDSTLLTMGLAA
jgi:hypothetical protein